MADLPTTEEIAARQAATESLAPAFRFSAAALLLGPLWAARSALWITFFWTATIELVGLVAIATGHCDHSFTLPRLISVWVTATWMVVFMRLL